jgi:hypothetical protein
MAVYDARPSAFNQLSTTSDWESLLSSLGCRDGIDPANTNAMAPSLDTGGRNAVIASGQAVIKGQLWRCDAPVSTPIPAASAQNRIDRLVLRLTRGATTSPTVVQPVVITGTPSGSPVIPPITQTPTGIYDITVSNWLSTSAGGLTTLVDERDFTRQQWNDMRPLTGSYVGTVAGEFPPQWRFDDVNGIVLVAGSIQLPGSGSYNGIDFYQFPSAYRPSQSCSWPVAQLTGTASTDTTTGFPRLFVGASGGLSVAGISPSLNGAVIRINGFFPLQGYNGLIPS